MIIRLNKNQEIITEFSNDIETKSIKVIDKMPTDINEYVYKYINGEIVRYKPINLNSKSQQQINNEQNINNERQDEINVDLDYRITMLELGL